MARRKVVGVDLSANDGGVMWATVNVPLLGEYAPRWVELRDAAGKLQAKWDPGAGVLEIQARGVKSWYHLEWEN